VWEYLCGEIGEGVDLWLLARAPHVALVDLEPSGELRALRAHVVALGWVPELRTVLLGGLVALNVADLQREAVHSRGVLVDDVHEDFAIVRDLAFGARV